MKYLSLLSVLILTMTPALTAQDTVHVTAGWNIIGSVATGNASAVLCTEPPGIIVTAFYGYVPGVGYDQIDTLVKGVGYWVKVSGDGMVVFDGSCGGDTGVCSVPIVEYGGESYATVAIGTQCWLAKNLNVGTRIDGVNDQADNATLEKYCYNNDTANCTTYGGLYQWDEAMQYSATPGAPGICPPGWHIPTSAEFQTLSSAVGGDGNALKSVGQGTGGGAGTNASGFSALFAGDRDEGEGGFDELGSGGSLWSSTERDPIDANTLLLRPDDGIIDVDYYFVKGYGLSVRCLED
jgi:uncharacterized protein (TIGR02145 family)